MEGCRRPQAENGTAGERLPEDPQHLGQECDIWAHLAVHRAGSGRGGGSCGAAERKQLGVRVTPWWSSKGRRRGMELGAGIQHSGQRETAVITSGEE